MTTTATELPAGTLLLQGGAEFGAGCREMDGELLSAAPRGPVVIVLAAATPGRDHDAAAGRAEHYYESWGRTVRVAPHPEIDPAAAAEAVSEAAVVVLPGGSPTRLLRSLLIADQVVGEALLGRFVAGAAVSGASAGAMVLCRRVVLPDRGRAVEGGLDLVPGLVQPHFAGRFDWVDPEAPLGPRWGLPECGGLLLAEGRLRAVGQGVPQMWRAGGAVPLPQDPTPLSELVA